MKFQEKYISKQENDLFPDPKRITISDDTFALGELLDLLVKKIEELKVNLK